MIIEEGTNYSFWVQKNQKQLIFNDILFKARSFTEDFDCIANEELNKMLDRGVEIITTEPQMQKYLDRFGQWHYNKLMYAFQNLKQSFLKYKEIEIVDYGCGQGIGAFIYGEFLKNKQYAQEVKCVTLIEPSKKCLERAALHVRAIFPKADIRTVNKYLNDIEESDFKRPNNPTLHIYSNILDVKSVDLEKLSSISTNELYLDSQFVCLSPRNDSLGFTKRVDLFARLLKGKIYYTKDLWRSDWEGECAMSLRLVEVSETFSEKQTIIDEILSKMIKVDSGTFWMGATACDSVATEREKPRHLVSLSSFYICCYPITQLQWECIMGYNPSRFRGDELPVDSVSYKDCQEFITKLNHLSGLKFSLPTEAQWEFAASGGNLSKKSIYQGCDNLDKLAWFSLNAGQSTCPVGGKKPNELGIYDMLGNVWEWCEDFYKEDFYKISHSQDPISKHPSGYCICRGGSWRSHADRCRISYRLICMPDNGMDQQGFRLVCPNI